MKLLYNFKCLDGEYELIVDDRNYIVNSTISCFETRTGVIEDADKFNDLINKANIKSWDKEYKGELITDSIEWSIEYDGYKSRGYETYEPYNYDYLIEAIKLIEKNGDYFKAGE